MSILERRSSLRSFSGFRHVVALANLCGTDHGVGFGTERRRQGLLGTNKKLQLTDYPVISYYSLEGPYNIICWTLRLRRR